MPFEQFEPRHMLANTDTSGAFSILLDNAPGDVNGFDGNLALYQSGLVYNSRTVADGAIQFVESNNLPSFGGLPPTNVRADLTFDDVPRGTYYWTVAAGVQLTHDVLFRVPLDFSVATGRHKWSISATYSNPGSGYSDVTRTYGTPSAPNYISYVSREASAFGNGWFNEDLATLKVYSGTAPDPNGLLLITGDGEPTWFGWNGNAYVREAGDQRFYTVSEDPTLTYFILTDKFGSSMKFQKNAPSTGEARLVSKADASGNERQFTYFASGENLNKLQSILHVPTGNRIDFGYSASTVTITEWVGTNSRIATGTLTSGQLTSMRLPDPDDFTSSGGSNGPLLSPLWEYAYNGTTGLLTRTTDPVGNNSVFAYGTGPRNETVVSITQANDTSDLTAFNSNGTGRRWPEVGTLNAVDASFGLFFDEFDKLTQFQANATGFITRIIDNSSVSTTYDRNADGLVTRIVTSDPDDFTPIDNTNGPLFALETTYTYDTRGNVESETKRALGSSTILAQQTWKYGNPDYSLPTKHVDERAKGTGPISAPHLAYRSRRPNDCACVLRPRAAKEAQMQNDSLGNELQESETAFHGSRRHSLHHA